MGKIKVSSTQGKFLEISGGDIAVNKKYTAEDFKYIRNTIKDMLAISDIEDGDVCFVKGYHSVDDGGGGYFYWDANEDKANHNGGTIIDPNIVFPTDWSNTTQQSTWFTAGTGSGCWKRIYSGDVDVKWFGATGDGVTDDSNAFNSAIQASYNVFIPKGNYSISNVTPRSGSSIRGISRKDVMLIVNANDSGAFTYSSIYNLTIENLTITAKAGITGAIGILQTDRSNYTAYSRFRNIETYLNLKIAYKGFYIFQVWDSCRDGYLGYSIPGQTHQAISSIPNAYGQSNQTNLNQVEHCQFFRSDAPGGAVEIHYGIGWTFYATDFEALNTHAVKAVGILGNIKFDSCWFEAIAAESVLVAEVSPAPNAQGTKNVGVLNCFANMEKTTKSFINIGEACSWGISNSTFAVIPAGVVLGTGLNANPKLFFHGNSTLSGAGAATFFDGFTSSISRAKISNSEILTGVINSPETQNANILPIGPTSLGSANFTVVGNYAALADVASELGFGATAALRYTMDNSFSWAYYKLPTKLTSFLRGKTVTLCIVGYGETADVNYHLVGKIWEDVVPDIANSSFSFSCFNVANTQLQSGSGTYTIGADTTDLYVGWSTGGANPNKTVIIEAMHLLLGKQSPILPGWK